MPFSPLSRSFADALCGCEAIVSMLAEKRLQIRRQQFTESGR
jgi:hypothetical protein